MWGAALALLYIALEPLVRARWPHSIVTWNRLLAGRWLDAQVGSHILIGATVGRCGVGGGRSVRRLAIRRAGHAWADSLPRWERANGWRPLPVSWKEPYFSDCWSSSRFAVSAGWSERTYLPPSWPPCCCCSPTAACLRFARLESERRDLRRHVFRAAVRVAAVRPGGHDCRRILHRQHQSDHPGHGLEDLVCPGRTRYVSVCCWVSPSSPSGVRWARTSCSAPRRIHEMTRLRILKIAGLLTILAASGLPAQTWIAQTSRTTASLRGVSAPDAAVVWASGTGGTYLRTLDGGATWHAAVLPGAEDLDFRAVHALDSHTAWLLSSGPGAKSAIFKTSDGGAHWSRLFTNPDAGGFFDALAFWDAQHGIVLGDPVDGQFVILTTDNGGQTWQRRKLPLALPNEGAFAASNSCLAVRGKSEAWFGTGGPSGARVFHSTGRGRALGYSRHAVAARWCGRGNLFAGIRGCTARHRGWRGLRQARRCYRQYRDDFRRRARVDRAGRNTSEWLPLGCGVSGGPQCLAGRGHIRLRHIKRRRPELDAIRQWRI